MLALVACGTVALAADPRPARPALEEDDLDAFDDEAVEPSLPDEEPPGVEEPPGPEDDAPVRPPGAAPRSRPSLPDEDEPPPTDLEPARSAPGARANPAQPLAPVQE
jgi:hypothetical protein